MVLSEISTPPPIDITSIEINSKEKGQLRGSLLANMVITSQYKKGSDHSYSKE
jgi:hypothetical protein